jgi:hypothetical protein
MPLEVKMSTTTAPRWYGWSFNIKKVPSWITDIASPCKYVYWIGVPIVAKSLTFADSYQRNRAVPNAIGYHRF